MRLEIICYLTGVTLFIIGLGCILIVDPFFKLLWALTFMPVGILYTTGAMINFDNMYGKRVEEQRQKRLNRKIEKQLEECEKNEGR